jgi:SOS-response transcriptional repressor LexA
MIGLTKQQMYVFEYIQHYIKENGTSPTFADICHGTGIKARSQVHRQVTALQRRGYLTCEPHCARSITVLFSLDGTPQWEAIARALYAENIKIRREASRRGVRLKTPKVEVEQ